MPNSAGMSPVSWLSRQLKFYQIDEAPQFRRYRFRSTGCPIGRALSSCPGYPVPPVSPRLTGWPTGTAPSRLARLPSSAGIFPRSTGCPIGSSSLQVAQATQFRRYLPGQLVGRQGQLFQVGEATTVPAGNCPRSTGCPRGTALPGRRGCCSSGWYRPRSVRSPRGTSCCKSVRSYSTPLE